jgi:hypothetical protein
MSVAEIGLLHGRYVRLTDRFKAIWSHHQFVSAVYKTFLHQPLPYNHDFQKTYERIKAVMPLLNSAQAAEAAQALTLSELAVERTTTSLLRADDQISASLLRRFFEKLKRQDESIVHFLIKFYLYAGAVDGDRRDKVDFLFTRIGEDFVAERGEYWSRDSLEFREKVIALVAAMRLEAAPQEEVVRVIRQIRAMRDEIQDADVLEELTERSLLKNARAFKHALGDLYFQPDVLLAIVELNVATKNKYLRLYHEDEQKIVEDSQKLMEHGDAIERNFGVTNPELIEEIARFRDFKERFDTARASSNVKHDVITQLKHSMSNILSQLDRGLAPDAEVEELPPAFFDHAQQVENITSRFGSDPVLHDYLLRIAAAVEVADPSAMPEEIVEYPNVRDLRIEAWEVAAYQKLFERRPPEADEDNDELWTLYLRAAALRIKVDDEATLLAAAVSAGAAPEPELLAKAKQSLDCAKSLDELFSDLLREAVYYSNPKLLHQLYRSRFRLLRGFSGLWLIYDRGGQPAAVS